MATAKQIEKTLSNLPTGRDAESVAKRNDELKALVASLRAKGAKHSEVADALGIGLVKAQVLSYQVEEDEVEPTAKNVVKLRDKDGKSWGRIAAATGLTESAVKKLYTEAAKVETHRVSDIGRGGRPPLGAKATTKAKATKATPKKAAAKKTTTKKKASPKKTTATKAAPAKRRSAVKRSAVKKTAANA